MKTLKNRFVLSSYRIVSLLLVGANEKSLNSQYKDGFLSVTFEKMVH